MKPVVPIKFRSVNNPAKNYIFNLLYHDIQAANPGRSLDAGMGRMRNFWMFPGKYVGIGVKKADTESGLRLEDNIAVMRERGEPELYLALLEKDISFLGDFDLCVSTFTLIYVEDKLDTVARLSDRVRRGGTLLFQVPALGTGEEYLRLLSPHYDTVEIVYWGMAHTNFFMEPFDKPRFKELERAEMEAPNTPEGHSDFYVRAFGKRTDPSPQGPTPELIRDGLFRIVARDLAYVLDGQA
jgi:hypothetical protein